MPQVFISYKREERDIARRLADRIEAAGLSVWWDPQLRAGDRFDDVIEAAIHSADCVVVIWSAASVQSRYVRDEAALALKLEKLVPVAIDSETPPFRFQSLHTYDLTGWKSDQPGHDCSTLIGDLQERCVRHKAPGAEARSVPSTASTPTLSAAPPKSKSRAVLTTAFISAIAAAAFLWIYNTPSSAERRATVSQAPAPPASQEAGGPTQGTGAALMTPTQRPDEPLRPIAPAKDCSVLNKFSREEWRRQFIGTSFQDTWMVYVASGNGNAGADEAAALRATFERKHPNIAFAAIPTISRKDDNERFAIAIALGLVDPTVADRLVWLAKNCEIAKDAYQYQQR